MKRIAPGPLLLQCLGISLVVAWASVAMSASTTPLLEAVNTDDPTRVNQLLKEGADPNQPSESGILPLVLAAWKGSPEILELLIAHGADVHLEGVGGSTALVWASGGGNLDCVEPLLRSGADSNARGDIGLEDPELPGSRGEFAGMTALMWAARGGHASIVELLISHGAEVNARTFHSDLHALWFATFNGRVEVVRLLLSNSSDYQAVMRSISKARDTNQEIWKLLRAAKKTAPDRTEPKREGP